MASGHGVSKPNKAHSLNRKVDIASLFGQGTTVPNSDYTGMVDPHGVDPDRTDYASIHASRLERRRPEGDTW